MSCLCKTPAYALQHCEQAGKIHSTLFDWTLALPESVSRLWKSMTDYAETTYFDLHLLPSKLADSCTVVISMYWHDQREGVCSCVLPFCCSELDEDGTHMFLSTSIASGTYQADGSHKPEEGLSGTAIDTPATKGRRPAAHCLPHHTALQQQ